ncbi:hypothetical protein, partial [Massilia sp.]|uniref:hypothetical protein n=1 Tax=Massilia sp. TaxID=1882437 RepID=UPI0028AC3885
MYRINPRTSFQARKARSGRRGRRFESSHPDHEFNEDSSQWLLFLFLLPAPFFPQRPEYKSPASLAACGASFIQPAGLELVSADIEGAAARTGH